MSKAEQKKVDIKKIASSITNGLFGMAALMLLGDALSIYIEDDRIASYTFFLSIAIGIPYILIRTNSNTVNIKDDTR